MNQPVPDTLRIAVAQLNPIVGDVAGNLAKAREARADAARQGADLVLFTELFIGGYPPEDLVLRPAFVAACERAVEELAKDTADGGPGVVIGTPLKRKSGLHNSVMVLDGGEVIAERYKLDLPNYGEFDEKRVFQPGPDMPGPVNFRGVRLGIPICEDIWGQLGVCETLAESGAEILLVPNGSPYYRGKVDVRQQIAIVQVIEFGLPMIWANQLGGQDELVFDGASFAISGRQVAGLPDERVRGGDLDLDVEARPRRRRRAKAGIRWLGLPRRADVDDPAKGGGRLPRLHAGPQGLRQQERLQERGARPFGRHRFGAVRGTRRRRAGRGAGVLRDDALSLHLEGLADGRRGLRPRARLPLRRGADRRAGGRLFGARCRSCSRARRKASPRRTCRAARAAPS